MARVGHSNTQMRDLRQTIHDAMFKLYACSERLVIPRFERVLVYVVPKERMSHTGRIVMPDMQQNKPIYEGVVVRTYEPQVRTLLVENEKTGQKYPKEFVYASIVEPGDHIIFPHYEGMPVSTFLDEKEFRIIHEEQIHGKLDYREKGANEDEVGDVIENTIYNEGGDPDVLTKQLLEKFHIVRKNQKALTTSGM